MILNMTAWTDHVRSMAKEYGLTYKAAMSDARVKASFSKAPRKRLTSEYVVPGDLDDEETKANRAAAMARVKAMKAKRLANPPAPRVKKPMSEETKAMLKERRIRKAETRPSSPVESTPAERKARRAMAASRAMELTQNKPVDYVPKARKPMSEETKAMLKARREARKADVAAKFQKFWNKHEGVADATESIISSIVGQAVMNEGVSGAVDSFLADIVGNAVSTMPKPTKKRAKPGQGKGRGVQKMSEETKALLKARRKGSEEKKK